MCGAALCLVTAVFGVDVGWQPLPDGGMEYIIQIEPHMLRMLENGEQIVSDIPPSLRGVRSYRITVGTDELPRVGAMPAEAAPPGLHQSQLPPAEEASSLPPEMAMEAQPAPTGGQSSEAQGVTGQGNDANERQPPPRLPGGPLPHRASPIPGTLVTPADPKPISEAGLDEKAAAFIGRQTEEAAPSVAHRGDGVQEDDKGNETTAQEEVGETQQQRRVAPSTLTLAGLLCGSFGGMLYVGWIAWDYRRQYHALLARVIEAGAERVEVDETMVDGSSMDEPG